jgi:hypothetical protein
MLKFLARRSYKVMAIILVGDSDAKVKDNYNAELDVLSDLSQGTTKSDSCIDMVLVRNGVNLSCVIYDST